MNKNEFSNIEILLSTLDKKLQIAKLYYDIYNQEAKKVTKYSLLGEYEHYQKAINFLDPNNPNTSTYKALNDYQNKKNEVAIILSTIVNHCINSGDILNTSKEVLAILDKTYHEKHNLSSIFSEAFLESSLSSLKIAINMDFPSILQCVSETGTMEMEDIKIAHLRLKHSLTFSILGFSEIFKEDSLKNVFLNNDSPNIGNFISTAISDAFKINPDLTRNFTLKHKFIYDILIDQFIQNSNQILFRDIIHYINDNKYLTLFIDTNTLKSSKLIYTDIINKLSLKNVDIEAQFQKDPLWIIINSNHKEFSNYLKNNNEPQLNKILLLTKSLVISQKMNYSEPLIKKQIMGDESHVAKIKFDIKNNIIETKRNSFEIIDIYKTPSTSPLLKEKGNKIYENILNEYKTIIKRLNDNVSVSDLNLSINYSSLLQDKDISSNFYQDFSQVEEELLGQLQEI